MSGAGRVPAVRYRSSRGRHRPDGAGRASSEGPVPVSAAFAVLPQDLERASCHDAAKPARIALVRTARGSSAGEVRLLVLDDGRRLRVDAEEVARLGLEPGLVLAPTVLMHLERRDAYRSAREIALRLLGARPRSIADLRGRLRRAGVPPDAAASVVADLVVDGYLDDLEFARTWVRGRVAVRACGMLRLRSELREKGVAMSLIEQAISEVYGEEDAAVAEERRARDLAERRLRSYAHLAWEVRVRRLAGFLQRRGFAAPTIARVLRTVQRSRESSDA